MDLREAKPAGSPLPKLIGCVAFTVLLAALTCLGFYWKSEARLQRHAINAAAERWEEHGLDQLFEGTQFQYIFERNDTITQVTLNWTDVEDNFYIHQLRNTTDDYPVSYHLARGNLTDIFPDFKENLFLRFYVNAQRSCFTVNSIDLDNSTVLLKGLDPCTPVGTGYQGGLQVQYWKHVKVPIDCESPQDCAGKCLLASGNWVGFDSRGSCYRFVLLDRLCVKVVPVRISSDKDTWAYDGGCYSEGEFAKYKRISPLRTYNFSAFPLEVRLNKDPIIVAFNVSGDDISLAPSSLYYITWSQWLIVLSLVLVGFALYLHWYHQQKEESYREQVDVMASLPE